jgi:signal transduction histidine kinase/CheY-like chemotaxis protein
MSELSRLHRKIVNEMSVHPVAPPRAAFPEHDVEEKSDGAVAKGDARLAALRPAIAAAGVLASIGILGAGFGAEMLLLPVGMSLAGLLGTSMIVRDWHRGRAGAPIMPTEHAIDRTWEAREADHSRFAVHDALGDLAILRDGQGLIIEANETFRRHTGIAKPEGLRCEALGLSLRPAGTSGRYRIDIATTDERRSFEWHDILTRDPGTGALRIISVGRDVTVNVAAARDSAAALRRAEAESRAKSHLLATVSHEIRTPLSGILGMSDLLDQTGLSASQASYLAGMRQSGHDLVQLVDDLLDCASMEAGRFSLRPSRQSLRPLIESVVEMLSHRAHGKGIEIASTVAADVPDMLEIDGPRLKQVLFNVVGNAVKFTATGGVLVRASEERGMLVLRVTDTGPGMTAADQTRIFDAFEQAGDTAARAAGTGLGLAISRRIVRAFGGDITVNSRLGAGSIFEIRFPLVTSSVANPTRRTRTLSASRVLLVAPKGPAAEAIAATIETLGGRCRIASTLEEGRRVVAMSLDVNDTEAAGEVLTDIIVDHRHAELFHRICEASPRIDSLNLRKTYLVNPEERAEQLLQQTDGFHAWLIRPLRERSLIAVLKGHLKGLEQRDALNDNRPVLRDEVPETAFSAGRVLLGEDDPVNAAILRVQLERAGFDVRLVSNFTGMEDILSSGEVERPALLVTDLNMPGGSGLDMLRALRLREATMPGIARLPVIVQTSDPRAETRQALVEAGADTVIAKPATASALVDAARSLLAG